MPDACDSLLLPLHTRQCTAYRRQPHRRIIHFSTQSDTCLHHAVHLPQATQAHMCASNLPADNCIWTAVTATTAPAAVMKQVMPTTLTACPAAAWPCEHPSRLRAQWHAPATLAPAPCLYIINRWQPHHHSVRQSWQTGRLAAHCAGSSAQLRRQQDSDPSPLDALKPDTKLQYSTALTAACTVLG